MVSLKAGTFILAGTTVRWEWGSSWKLSFSKASRWRFWRRFRVASSRIFLLEMSLILPNKMNNKFTSSMTNFPDNGHAGKMLFANYNELSDSTLKLTLFVCFAHGKNKIKIFPSYLKMESIRNWASLIFSARGQKPCHDWHSQRFLKFPAFPRLFPDKCKISPAHCINNFTHQTWW